MRSNDSRVFAGLKIVGKVWRQPDLAHFQLAVFVELKSFCPKDLIVSAAGRIISQAVLISALQYKTS
jgi:hypothetical protein